MLEFALAGDLGGGEMAAADNFRIFSLRFFESGEVFLGDDENGSAPAD